MYKITGADGNEYGPVSLEQLKRWVAEGRVNAQTRLRDAGAGDWMTAGDFPELSGLFGAPGGEAQPGSPPSIGSAAQSAAKKQGLAIASLVLGICSIALCLTFLTGIPAIICGHIAHSRTRRSPNQYGGAGLAIAGFVMGYVSIFITILLVAMLLPALAPAEAKSSRIGCANNMKQIGIAFKTWTLDNGDQFPFNVSTNQGGTLELCSRDSDGYDRNSAFHFQVMSNELSTPRILLCPHDSSKRPATDWQHLQPANVSYLVRSGTNITEVNPQEILAICPICGNVLFTDASVQQVSKSGLARFGVNAPKEQRDAPPR
jgi:hypothetical protein